MNFRSIQAIYVFEMTRFFRTLLQSFVSPVISTCLYFVVFGAAIGGRIDAVEGVNYIAFIVPGLIMLSVMTQAVSNASFGIYFPKFIGTIYEVLSAPINFLEIVVGYVGAAASKALFIGLVILATSLFFVDIEIIHPIIMILFFMLIKTLLDLAFKATDYFSSLVIIGLTSIMFSHIFVNSAMTIGLMPVKGLPTPFVSAGGSFMLLCFIILALVSSLSKN